MQKFKRYAKFIENFGRIIAISSLKWKQFSQCDEHFSFWWSLIDPLRYLWVNPISSETNPSGIGDCSKTHVYIDLKVLDYS